jgi:vitellogenic carboxypeptidase-like protein
MLPEYAPQLYSVGLVDENEFETFAEASARAVNKIDAGDYLGAFKIFDTLLNGDLCQCHTLFQNATGCTNYFNYLVCIGEDLDAFARLFQNPQIRKAIHVGDQPFHTDNTVEEHLANDIMQSVKPEIRDLLNGNQIDVCISYILVSRDVLVSAYHFM